jgi:nickel-dependent lactate racemase
MFAVAGRSGRRTLEIDLLYGRDSMRLRLPGGCRPTVVRKPEMPVLQDAGAAVAAALDDPVGCAPLVDLARGKSSACILICDITRPVPNGLFLRPMIERLLAAGMPRDGISILVATGLHRPNLGDELAEIVGDPWVMENIRIANHDARDDAAHVDLGRTSTGTVVRLERALVEADLRIATGLVEPHFMAGYSGGRKVIAPGVAHAETITTFHSHRFMAHPKAANCVLDGNPLHNEQLEIVGMLGGALALNTVIDEHRRLSFVNFGEVVESHLGAVAFTRRFAEVPLQRKFRTVVTTSAGYPLDKTYYQTVKGMVGPLGILEAGGDLIIVSQCSEGIGSPEYAEAQERLIARGVDGFLGDISKKSHADIDEWQTQMQTKPMQAGRIWLYSELHGEARSLTGVELIDDVAAAVADSISRQGDDAVAVIPEGPYVIPYVA